MPFHMSHLLTFVRQAMRPAQGVMMRNLWMTALVATQSSNAAVTQHSVAIY